MGYMVSVETIQLCCCSPKIATGNTQTQEHSCVPEKMYLPKWDPGPCLLTPDLENINKALNIFLEKL